MSGLNLWISHRMILRRVIFKGKLEAKSPLRIGAERRERLGSTIDLTVLRYASGEPYIPGSSLKGVFRSTGEKLAGLKGVYTCTGIGQQTCTELSYVESNKLAEWLKFQRMRARGGDYKEIYSIILKTVFEKTCINCKLFGAPSIAGVVNFYDATPIKYSLGVRTGIAINRATGAAARGAIYKVEYVEPGSVFNFSMSGINLPNYAVGYLANIIDEINSGAVRIGGFKTRGFGKVEISLEELIIRDNKEGDVLPALDEYDREIDVAPGKYSGEYIDGILEKFKAVWGEANIGYPVKD